jgi:hypothetical protein
MITIESATSNNKPRGARKATLTKKAVVELRAKIECALQGQERRIGPSAVTFLASIRKQLAAAEPRLSKKQRDVTDEILLQASFGEPLVILEGEEIVDLGRLVHHAAADCRVSSLGENVMASLKYRLHEPIIALSMKRWRVIEDIKQKTHFGLPGEPPPLDIDGLVEDDDPDGLPPERRDDAFDDAEHWSLVGVDVDED